MKETGATYNNKNILILVIIAAVAISALNLASPALTLVAAVAAVAFVILAKDPMYGLLFLIAITPFSGTELLNTQIQGIPGLKLFNLLAAAVLLFFFVYKKPMPVEGADKLFIFGLIILFTIAVIRSTGYISKTYNYIWQEGYSTGRFFLSHLIKPLLVFLPFILIVYYVRSVRDIKKIIYGIVISIFVLSGFLLYLYALSGNKANFEAVRLGFAAVLGLHGNNLADFYITTYPLILAYTMSKKNVFLIITTLLSIVAIGIIYSRSAYVVVIICTLLFLVVSHRSKWLPVLAAAGLLGYSLIPQSIIQRALTGLNDANLNDVSAGRTSDIWLPLIREYAGQPLKILFGSGRYAIMGTDAFSEGLILRVSHAHNMYLDMILDSGIIGLAFFLIFFALIFYRLVKSHPHIKDKSLLHLMYGIEISITAFMIRGITDSFFFPSLTNAFLWIVLAVGLTIAYAHKPEEVDGHEYAENSHNSQHS